MSSSITPKGRVIVVGGSLAGLFAANTLIREGWDVTLYERVADSLDGRGAGIATHEELFDAMRRAGAKVDEFIGIPVVGRTAFDRAGREIDHFPYQQYLTSWTLLYRRLRAVLPRSVYRQGGDVVDVEDGPQAARVTFADGTRDTADLVVGADGIWSTVRAKCSPGDVPTYTGYVAWRGLVEEAAFSASQRERYGAIHGFYTTAEHQLVHFAVAGADDSVEPGRRRFSFLWYRPYDEESELYDLLTDVDGKRNLRSISPLKIHPRHIRKLREDALEQLPPDFADTVCRAEGPFVQPIYDLVCGRIAFKRIALVGDAAFTARPHVGAGVTKAGGDAIALAETLRDEPEVARALEEYRRRREPFGRAIVERGRYLGGYLESPKRGAARKPPLSAQELIRECAMPIRLAHQEDCTP